MSQPVHLFGSQLSEEFNGPVAVIDYLSSGRREFHGLVDLSTKRKCLRKQQIIECGIDLFRHYALG